MTALPSGTVTFLMSDVESSTALWLRHRVAMDGAMVELDRAVRDVVVRHGGVSIQSRGEGDSHFAAFGQPSAAVLAAVDLQRVRAAVAWPKVRVAVHTAEAVPVDGDYLGASVNATARLRATAHGGQVVCSRTVADLASDALTLAGIDLRSLGNHRLRDLPAPVELFQACAAGIPRDFPPLVSLDLQATALMAIAVVDQVGSMQRVRSEGHPAIWQRDLFRRFRTAAYDHDGRFVKLVGDGCMAAFEDPRSALAFASELCGDAHLSVCAAVTAGLIEVVEGELSGEAVFDAFSGTHGLAPGTLWASPVVYSLIGTGSISDHEELRGATLKASV